MGRLALKKNNTDTNKRIEYPEWKDFEETPKVRANREKGLRWDGSKKDKGWQGEQRYKDKSGNDIVSTELSRAGTVNGRNMEYPLIVPDTTEEEMKILLSGSTNDQIERKALEWAEKRDKQNKSPFYKTGVDKQYRKKKRKSILTGE